MSCPFKCECAACVARQRNRFVSGFKNLSLAERLEILHETSPFIRNIGTHECLEHIQQLYALEKNDSYYDIEAP